MTAGEAQPGGAPGQMPGAGGNREESHRAFGLVLVGMSIAVWWPAFTLGAWGQLFFSQLLTVWVAATAGLIVVLAQPRSMGRRWLRVLALLVPSLWLVLVLGGDRFTTEFWTAILDLLAIVVGIAGIPFTLWTLVRVVWPDLFADFRRRAQWGVFVTVAAIALVSFGLGANQSAFLTCEDFEISGNSDPPGCVHESPSPSPTSTAPATPASPAPTRTP